jgi:ribonucleoside-diphosphate reductase alpha chain
MKKINKEYFLIPAHLEIARQRYFLKDENGNCIEDDMYQVFERVTNYIYQNDSKKYKEQALQKRVEKKILDGGRILAQAGTKNKNLYNCFTIGIGDTREEILEAKRKHFSLQCAGGGVGLNFSSLRPNGSVCVSNQSRASGPVGFLSDFSYQSSNISQNGNRSGASLGLLEDWHPDLYDFVKFKSEHNWENIKKFANIFDQKAFSNFQWGTPYPWQSFNVSVLLSDKFMNLLIDDPKSFWVLKWKEIDWHLYDFDNDGKKITVVAPNDDMAFYKASCQIPYFNSINLKKENGPYDWTVSQWFKFICEHAWADGCPGVMFIDTARKYHNGEYFNKIEACNACSEQIMPINSVCCLTTLCLPSFVKNDKFDYNDFKETIKTAIRGLDNIIDISKIGEKEIDENSLKERRIGLGTTGCHELLIMNKLKYSSEEGRDFINNILTILRDTAYETSIELARERKPFPEFKFEGFSKSEFFKTLPEKIKKDIKKYGIRNVTLLTQQPAGTTGTILGVSQGCEPYFAMCYNRNSRVGSFLDGSPTFRKWLEENKIDFSKYNFSLEELKKDMKLPNYFEEANNISWQDHLKMQAVFSKNVCSNISKTVNLSNLSTVEDIQNIFLEAYKLGIKSTTIYRDGSKSQILEHVGQKKKERPLSIIPSDSPKRPIELPCEIYHCTIKGEVWTVIIGLYKGQPYELFCAPQERFEIPDKIKTGKIIKNGGGKYNLDINDIILKNISGLLACDEHRIITRQLSLSLRHGVPIAFINQQLSRADGTVVDFSKAILRVLRKYEKNDELNEENKAKCSNCGSDKIKQISGCWQCLNCNYSKCE